ncbi:MAG: type IV pilus biogenesis protein PilP [Pantoea sp.]|uniref:type IV pilus biogenesis protein PilP n=2 Tax=Enterobacterales TaxID=91347 RepID=UPI0028A13F46|nr:MULTISPECIES: type IV pilus biogenesis protein PilP [Pantoea]MDU5836238.1 type IV pilus biogenesis protein PilP [Pantoea sp.]MDU6438334.1 type IV pilus biogenesis protein PilP [Pantoea sp.]
MENVKYAALMLLACGFAHAEADVKTVGDIDRLQSGRVFYDAKAAYNKAKMAAGEADIMTAKTPPASVPGAPAVSSAPVAQVSTLPTLEKVAGAVATLSFADGSSTQVRPGDSVSGGYTVVSVSMRGVVIKRALDGRVFTLN